MLFQQVLEQTVPKGAPFADNEVRVERGVISTMLVDARERNKCVILAIDGRLVRRMVADGLVNVARKWGAGRRKRRR